MVTVKQAAHQLNRTERRVRAVIKSRRLKAVKLAGVWLIKESDLAKYQPRKTGAAGHDR